MSSFGTCVTKKSSFLACQGFVGDGTTPSGSSIHVGRGAVTKGVGERRNSACLPICFETMNYSSTSASRITSDAFVRFQTFEDSSLSGAGGPHDELLCSATAFNWWWLPMPSIAAVHRRAEYCQVYE